MINIPEASSTKSTTVSRLSTKSIVLSGMFAAILAAISQISIPMPTGVPITIQVFGIALVGAVLGWRLGLFATLAYILIGAAGVPVFAGFRGGIASLTGLAGGYILAWPIMVIFCGLRFRTESKRLSLLLSILFALLGLIIDEIAGGVQWSLLSGGAMTLQAVFAYSMVAFVPKDVIITILAVVIGRQIRKPLYRSGYLD